MNEDERWHYNQGEREEELRGGIYKNCRECGELILRGGSAYCKLCYYKKFEKNREA